VDVGDNTTTGNGGLDEGVELLISTDGKQQVTRGDTLHLEVLARVTGKLKHLSSEVLHDSGRVDSGRGSNALVRMHTGLEESVDTTHRELEVRTLRARHRGALGRGGLATLAALAALATVEENVVGEYDEEIYQLRRRQ
jgi:hypothetical protein